MQRRYMTTDVFTDHAFGGNPLAVVLDAGGLSTAQMQAIASEFNYAETTFVLPARDSAHDAQVRIFTVKKELRFAGHPNVGTAFVLATQASKPPARFLFEEGAGLVPVEILEKEGRAVGAELTAPQPLKKFRSFSAAEAAACISLSAADVRTDGHPALIASVGLPFLMLELASRDALRRAKPDAAAFTQAFPCDGSDAVYLYTRDVPGTEACDLQARMFFPGSSGLTEDPATGSATVAAAALLADLSGERDGELKLRVGQGVDMGRPSLLLTRVRKQNGVIASAHVGGGLRADDGGHVSAAGRGVRRLHSLSLRGAKRRSNPVFFAALDCFAALAMTVTSAARPDFPPSRRRALR
jgi:trans-2,3-dihydro-3-hydroxyanthranilate isomerase